MKAMIVLCDGFEEIEAFTVIDVLRRSAVEVTTVGLSSSIVEGAHKIRTHADTILKDIKSETYDAIILPGGPGYKTLLNSNVLVKTVQEFNKNNKIIGAICAAPVVLAKAGILDGRLATVYPGLEKELPKPRDAKVIVDKNVVTSKSPGTAMEFSLKLSEILTNKQTSAKVRAALVLN